MKVSIISPCWIQHDETLDVTKKFVDSVLKYTKADFELLLIDNDCNEEGKKYLSSIKDERVKVLDPKENLGWVKGVNYGFKHASGEYLCMMNNDIEVTEAWMTKMLEKFDQKEPNHLLKNRKIGLVGPTTDHIAGVQRKEFDDVYKTNCQHVDTIIGFCMVLPREVYDLIGGLDERFGMGHSDDLDYCFRVRKIGYEIVIARDVFIYHRCSVSMKKFLNGEEGYKNDLDEKLNILFDKWGREQAMAMMSVPSAGCIAIPHLEMMHSKFVVALTRMQKPSETSVVFTGGTVIEVVRNNLVDGMRGEWVLFLDSDMVPPPDTLKRLISHNKPIVGGLCFRRVPPYNPTMYIKPKDCELLEDEKEQYKWVTSWPENSLVEVDATGCACLLVKREVFEKIKRPYFKYDDKSEDINFCEKAREAGYKIYIDTGLIIGHLASIPVDDQTFKAYHGNK